MFQDPYIYHSKISLAILTIFFASCTLQRRVIYPESHTSIVNIEEVHSNVHINDWIAVTIDDKRYSNLKVLTIEYRYIVVERIKVPRKDRIPFMVNMADIQKLEIERVGIADFGGFIVTSLMMLFYLFA